MVVVIDDGEAAALDEVFGVTSIDLGWNLQGAASLPRSL